MSTATKDNSLVGSQDGSVTVSSHHHHHQHKTVTTTSSSLPRVPLSPTENLLVGAAGGCLETCLQMPVLTYKFCLQEGRAIPTTIPGFYRGVGVQAGTLVSRLR